MVFFLWHVVVSPLLSKKKFFPTPLSICFSAPFCSPSWLDVICCGLWFINLKSRGVNTIDITCSFYPFAQYSRVAVVPKESEMYSRVNVIIFREQHKSLPILSLLKLCCQKCLMLGNTLAPCI